MMGSRAITKLKGIERQSLKMAEPAQTNFGSKKQLSNRLIQDLLQDRADIAPDVDWANFLRRIQLHGVASIIYKKMNETKIAGFMPTGKADELRTIYLRNVLDITRKYQGVAQIIGLLKEANIDFILLKGPALGNFVYETDVDRNFGDVDILITEKSWPKAKGLLIDSGYHPLLGIMERAKGLTDNDVLEHTYFAKEPIGIEVQLDLLQLGMKMIAPDDVWRTRQTIRICEQDVSIASNEFQLIHLLTHLNKHGFRRLIWCYDIYRLIGCKTIDWAAFVDIAKTEKVEVFALNTLRFLMTIFDDLEIPAAALERLRVSPLKDRVWRHFWPAAEIACFKGLEGGPAMFHKPIKFKWVVPNMLLAGRTAIKLNYMVRKLVPPKEFLQSKYASRKNYLYLYASRIINRVKV